MDRRQIISATYESFRKARRLPDADLVAEVVGLVLQVAEQPGLTADERRYLESCVLCAWATPYSESVPSGCVEYDQLPDATRLVPMVGTASQPARCTLFD